MLEFKKENLMKLAKMKMPFGKYSGWPLIDLPEHYVVWFSQNGYPEGELGKLLEELYEIKLNGLEFLFKNLKNHES